VGVELQLHPVLHGIIQPLVEMLGTIHMVHQEAISQMFKSIQPSIPDLTIFGPETSTTPMVKLTY
jgi:hypothetical protein